MRQYSCGDLLCAVRFIFLEALAQSNYMIICIAEGLIKLNDLFVGCPNLEINFRATFRSDASFDLFHYETAISIPAITRIYRKIINPTAVPLIAAHYGGDNLFV